MFVPLALHDLSDYDLRQLVISAAAATLRQPVVLGPLLEAAQMETARRRGEHRVHVGGLDLCIGSPDADPALVAEARREALIAACALRDSDSLPMAVQDVWSAMLIALDDHRRAERAEREQLAFAFG